MFDENDSNTQLFDYFLSLYTILHYCLEIKIFKSCGATEEYYAIGYSFANDPVTINDWIPGKKS